MIKKIILSLSMSLLLSSSLMAEVYKVRLDGKGVDVKIKESIIYDENGFDQNGINIDTGTIYNEEHYDLEGYIDPNYVKAKGKYQRSGIDCSGYSFDFTNNSLAGNVNHYDQGTSCGYKLSYELNQKTKIKKVILKNAYSKKTDKSELIILSFYKIPEIRIYLTNTPTDYEFDVNLTFNANDPIRFYDLVRYKGGVKYSVSFE